MCVPFMGHYKFVAEIRIVCQLGRKFIRFAAADVPILLFYIWPLLQSILICSNNLDFSNLNLWGFCTFALLVKLHWLTEGLCGRELSNRKLLFNVDRFCFLRGYLLLFLYFKRLVSNQRVLWKQKGMEEACSSRRFKFPAQN